MDRHQIEQDAMARALALAATPGTPLGPNPRVGCVLLSPEGDVVAEGRHRGAGTAHAEVDALRRAGDRARGATAVVTLEPCNHTGRTGPCAQALVEAGVARVVHAQSDPNPVAAGGAERLRAAGVEVVPGVLADQASALNRAWTFGLVHQRPFVTWKFAAGLDGRSAAADGTSRWISSSASRRDVHALRASVDTVLVGTGTALADDPALTVRDAEGNPAPHQPLRAVMGKRSLPPGSRLLDESLDALVLDTLVLDTRDPREALARIFDAGRRHVLLEGGPTLAAAFLAAGLVDEVVAYVAPVLLGSGSAAVGDLGVSTIADAHRLDVVDVRTIRGEAGGAAAGPDAEAGQVDVRITLRPRTTLHSRLSAAGER